MSHTITYVQHDSDSNIIVERHPRLCRFASMPDHLDRIVNVIKGNDANASPSMGTGVLSLAIY
jgi:hypothetical protein